MSAHAHPLTIACIAADLVPGKLGGAEAHAVEVIKRLAKDHTILLFVGSDTGVARQLPQSVQVIPVAYPKLPNLYGLAFILWGYFQITSRLKRQPPDLIWAKQTYPQAPLAALLKRKLKKPLYITAQNPMLHQEELVIRGRFLQSFKNPLTSLLTPLIRWSYRHSDLVAAVSRYSARLARKLQASNVTVIPNGVDLSLFTYPEEKPPHHPLTLLTTSSLIPRNGIDILIAAVALLPPQPAWQLLIAGEGPMHTQLKKQVRTHQLTQQVKFLGRVANSDIPQLLSQADIFIRPSRWEGFGVSFIEAMAAGVPVIATPVGGIPDFLTHNQTGLLAQVENPQSVAEGINTLFSQPQLYRQIKHNARALVEQTYTWDTIARQVDRAFRRLAQKTP